VIASNHLASRPSARLDVFEPAGNLYEQLTRRLDHRHGALIEGRRLVTHHDYFLRSHEQFDTIIMINVLEHIEDDHAAIRAASESLVPGGIFAVFVPALPWLYSDFDEDVGHHRRYTQAALRRLMQEEHLNVVKSLYMDVFGVFPWFLLNVLGGIRCVRPRMVQLYDRFLIPITRRIERIGSPAFGKNLLMIGRKVGE
jgi:SAM-dependent methyltransferase